MIDYPTPGTQILGFDLFLEGLKRTQCAKNWCSCL